MDIFISNINQYINHYKIKQSFISLKCGIEKNKLSLILNGEQDILQEDMIKLAEALNKDLVYFTNNKLDLYTPKYNDISPIMFYMGTPTSEKEKLANTIFDFLEHVDAILGIRNNLEKHNSGVMDNGV